MNLPNIPNRRLTENVIQAFGGLNLLPNVAIGEFTDMENISNDYYPSIATRGKHSQIEIINNGLALTLDENALFFFNEKWGFISGGRLYYDGQSPIYNFCDTTTNNRISVNIGSLVCFFPDKKYYDVINHLSGDLEKTFTCTNTTGDLATVQLVFDDGTTAGKINFSTSAPSSPSTGDVYFYNDGDGVNCFRYNEYGDGSWNPISAVTYKFHHSGFSSGFSDGDTVTATDGAVQHSVDNTYTVLKYDDTNKDLYLLGIPEFRILQDMATAGSTTEYKTAFYGNIRRCIPDMSFVIECNNRLWGCSSDGHEIYSSRQGSAFNWNTFSGLVSDSYAATVGSDGAFTGAVNYSGYPMFFKEDETIRIYGNKPSNFRFSFSPGGVKAGAFRSIAVVGDVLYYMSRTGLYRYSGSSSQKVSEKLPDIDIIAGCGYKNKYYCSSGDVLYVFNPAHNTFSVEWKSHTGGDLTYDRITQFIKSDETLLWQRIRTYDGVTSLVITSIDGCGFNFASGSGAGAYTESKTVEGTIRYMLLSGDMLGETAEHKRVHGIAILATGNGSMTVDINYDDRAGYYNRKQYTVNGKGYSEIKIYPHRCRFYRLRIIGCGDIKIHGITTYLER